MKTEYLSRPDGASAIIKIRNGSIYSAKFFYPGMTNYIDHRYDGADADAAIEQLESWGWKH